MKLRASPTDQELQELIRAAKTGELHASDIATLASDLAKSGQIMPRPHRRTADVASTGGPTSLSTLLCPLFLRILGWDIPKLGVPGRPAGGLDVLSRIPGYGVHLSLADVRTAIDRCGYAHFAAGDQIAPLDARLFAMRQDLGAQTVPALVIASVLSKKLAVGVQTVGLDVRVAAHGNFGNDMSIARENSKLFCRVASALEIEATCILTDASRPYQPYIGRGEALLALFRLFSGEANHWLKRHADQCCWMAFTTVGVTPSSVTARTVYEAFASNVEAQGGSIAAFEDTARDVADSHQYTITAPTSGFPTIDLERLRQVIVSRQKSAGEDGTYPDPIGVILLVEDTQLVSTDEPIMTVRTDTMTNDLLNEMSACAVMSEMPPPAFGERISE